MSEFVPHPRKVFLLGPEFPTFGITGSRGSGKSTFLEFAMEWYYRHGYICLDWWASLDHENAYWCIPDIVQIGRWEKLETEDSTKLVDYLKKRFAGNDEANFQVVRKDDCTVICFNANWRFAIVMESSRHLARLVIDPDTLLAKSIGLRVYKDDSGGHVLYGRNPSRRGGRTFRLTGYPVLIIMPKSTLIKQPNPRCICGVSLADHDGQNWTCQVKQPLIKTITDDTPLKDIIDIASKEKRICVFNRGFYADERDAYRAMARFLKELPLLVLRGSVPREKCFCLGFREAGSIAPSGLKALKGDFATAVKRELQTFIREARHLRTVMLLDYQRSADIAKSIASQRDFQIFKRSTIDLIPEDYLWLLDSIEDSKAQAYENLDFDKYDEFPSIPTLKHHELYVLFPDRHFEYRTHGMAQFKHKRPSDTWAIDANVTIEYVDKIELNKEVNEKKIKAIQEKQKKQQQVEEAMKEADRLHEQEHLSWHDVAKRLGWLDKTGLPSGDSLKMRVRRWKEKANEAS